MSASALLLGYSEMDGITPTDLSDLAHRILENTQFLIYEVFGISHTHTHPIPGLSGNKQFRIEYAGSAVPSSQGPMAVGGCPL